MFLKDLKNSSVPGLQNSWFLLSSTLHNVNVSKRPLYICSLGRMRGTWSQIFSVDYCRQLLHNNLLSFKSGNKISVPIIPPIKSNLFTQNDGHRNQHWYSQESCTVSSQTVVDLSGFHYSNTFVCYFSSHKALSHKTPHYLAILTNEVGLAGVNWKEVCSFSPC